MEVKENSRREQWRGAGMTLAKSSWYTLDFLLDKTHWKLILFMGWAFSPRYFYSIRGYFTVSEAQAIPRVTLSLGDNPNVVEPTHPLSNPWDAHFCLSLLTHLCFDSPGLSCCTGTMKKYHGTVEAVGSASRGFLVYMRLKTRKLSKDRWSL